MKRYFAYALDSCGVNAVLGRLNRCKTKILLYHSVVKKERFKPSLDPADQCLTDEIFDKHLEFISSNFNVISFDDFFNLRHERSKINIIITFDDGFLNSHTTAYPILKKYNLKATFFVTTSFIAGEEGLWFLNLEYKMKRYMRNLPFEKFKEKLASLKKGISTQDMHNEPDGFFQPMNWDQIVELAQNPRISIGSHCKTHYPLTILPNDKLKDEIYGSKEVIEEKLKRKVNYISYPHGLFNNEVIRIAKEAGYKGGITTIHGFNDVDTDPYQMKRNEIGNRGNLNILSSVISGSWDMFKHG